MNHVPKDRSFIVDVIIEGIFIIGMYENSIIFSPYFLNYISFKKTSPEIDMNFARADGNASNLCHNFSLLAAQGIVHPFLYWFTLG